MRMLWHGVVALAVMADTVTSFHVVVPSAFAPARTKPRLFPTTPRMQMGFSTGSPPPNGRDSGKGVGGMGMPSGMDELFSDPEIMKAMQSPKLMQAMMEMQTGGPAAMAKYASDPEILGLMMKIQSKMGGMDGMGRMGGFEGMPGMADMGNALFSDPEIVQAMESPKVRQAMEEMRTGGPAAMAKYAGDPEFLRLIMKVQSKMASTGGGMRGLAGMPPMPAGMDKVLSDPEIVKALQNPKMIKAMMELQTGGAAAMGKYESDPEFAALLKAIKDKMPAPSPAVGAPSAAGKSNSTESDGMRMQPLPFKTAPGGGSFGFEAALNAPPRKPKEGGEAPPAPAGVSGSKEGEKKKEAEAGGGGLEAALKARIAEVEQQTEQLIDQQQRDAFERLKKRQTEQEAARLRYLETQKKYEQALRETSYTSAKQKEASAPAPKVDPDMKAFKERVDLMKTTERQWSEIKDMLRPIQVASGIKLLDTYSNEPTPAAYVLMVVSVLLPLFLVSETVSSLVAFFQACDR